MDRPCRTSTIQSRNDTIGTDEAVDTSLELVADHRRIVSIAAFGRADTGIVLISGDDPETNVRAESWRRLLAGAADGSLKIVVARTYPLAEAADALQFVLRRARRREGRAGAVTGVSGRRTPRGHPRDSFIPRVTCVRSPTRSAHALSGVMLMGSCQGFVEQ